MLHEVLLALSGHPSPLFDPATADAFPLITPAESASLASVGRLASLHRALKSHLSRISSYHPSLICRAVATSISSSQISLFQNLILDVEQQILTKDSSSVGAYDIVPLAGVVAKFQPWMRRFDWYWNLACFMYPADADPLSDEFASSSSSVGTGPSVLNRLRADSQTGYPDIEESALALLAVAERAWMRQLSAWLLNGATHRSATRDFFVSQDKEKSNTVPNHVVSEDLIPSFVTKDTAGSIVFIGKTLAMLSSKAPGMVMDPDVLISSTSRLSVQPGGSVTISTSHLRDLANLQSPISITAFSRIIVTLRSSVASRVVDEILPIHLFMRTLLLLRRFFLAGRGDFADAMIAEADIHIATRHQQTRTDTTRDRVGDLPGVMMKEGETSVVLAKTWSALAPTIIDVEAVDEEVEWAREHIFLNLAKPKLSDTTDTTQKNDKENLPGIPPVSTGVFEELLLSNPTTLSIRLDSAFDLFLGEDERQTYSSIHVYLLGIRRAHNHLSELWRQTPLRRDHPAPIRRGRAKKAFQVLRDIRRKRAARMHSLRAIWSSCSNALITLAEFGEYLAGDVIEQAWTTFHNWAFQSQSSTSSLLSQNGAKLKPEDSPGNQNQLPRDPEILAQGHRQFLVALVDALLLNDKTFTKVLKALFVHIDQLVAFVKRLEIVQHDIDLRDEGVMIGSKRNYEEEERDILYELLQASTLVNGDLMQLTNFLQKLSSRSSPQSISKQSTTGFEPYHSRTGIEHLLMKLEFSVSQPGAD